MGGSLRLLPASNTQAAVYNHFRVNMKLNRLLFPFIFFTFAFVCGALAQEGQLNTEQPKGVTVQQIIDKFATKEKEFKEARDLYTFRQDVRVQTLDGDTINGEYREVFDVTYDNQGHHLENVTYAPQSTLTEILMSPEDLQDIRHLLPFVLTSDEIPEYDILYVGQQQEDELHCYVFDIAPKKIEGKNRYFQGRIWVDDHDLQIVKTSGKTVPDLCNGHPCNEVKKHRNEENLFPKFTTWRQQIDGQYWFPVFTKADDELHFQLEGDVHIKEIVKYEDYKRFGSNVKILYEGKELPKGDQKPQNPPPDQKKPQ